MSKSLATVVQFPITPINTSYSTQLIKLLNRKIVMPRLRDNEQIWLDYTTQHATQFDIVCYKFEALEDATELAGEIAFCIAHEVAELIASDINAKA
jgi:hypothetical protein